MIKLLIVMTAMNLAMFAAAIGMELGSHSESCALPAEALDTNEQDYTVTVVSSIDQSFEPSEHYLQNEHPYIYMSKQQRMCTP